MKVLLALFMVLSSFPSLNAHEPLEKVKGQRVYVPTYTEVYRSSTIRIKAISTVTIHNVDPVNSIQVMSVASYDTSGKEVANLMPQAIKLSPLESTSFMREYKEGSDGKGANVIISWKSESGALPPLIESVLFSSSAAQGYSLISYGRVIEELR